MNTPSLKGQVHEEIEKIFRTLLPRNGLAVREEQVTLCHIMLDALLKNNIALCDAGVGIGKTYAYLTGCILLRKNAPHSAVGSLPVVVSTSSIALQDAIIEEYIPFLSRIFLENHIIQKPIRAIVRKGKERFVCDVRLAQRLEAVKDKKKNITSGTLMAGGSFDRPQKIMGLSENQRVENFIAASPFNYEENCLLYIPDSPLNVQIGSEKEVEYLAEQICRLVEAAHGHTLVLFTSYALMGAVYNQVKDRLPFPLLEVWRHSSDMIHKFKHSNNAVLFAAGSCWEGVDFPGDMVSSLIIVRLPFSVPNPLSEAEREQYPSLQDYIRAVIIPDMQVKLRQGFGRAIRTETDTCVISILDHRAAPGERYHQAVLEALPNLRITRKIKEVEEFIRAKKSSDYFLS